MTSVNSYNYVSKISGYVDPFVHSLLIYGESAYFRIILILAYISTRLPHTTFRSSLIV